MEQESLRHACTSHTAEIAHDYTLDMDYYRSRRAGILGTYYYFIFYCSHKVVAYLYVALMDMSIWVRYMHIDH